MSIEKMSDGTMAMKGESSPQCGANLAYPEDEFAASDDRPAVLPPPSAQARGY